MPISYGQYVNLHPFVFILSLLIIILTTKILCSMKKNDFIYFGLLFLTVTASIVAGNFINNKITKV
jgi:hypothetical protein